MRWSITKRLYIRGNDSWDEYTYDSSNANDDIGRFDPVLRANLQLGSTFIGATRIRIGWTIESNYSDYYLPINEPKENATDFAKYQRNLFNLSFDFNFYSSLNHIVVRDEFFYFHVHPFHLL